VISQEIRKSINAGSLENLSSLSVQRCSASSENRLDYGITGVGEFFLGYGLFLAKILTFFLLLLVLIVVISMISGKGKREKGSITVTHVI